jgi:hypothetical protein
VPAVEQLDDEDLTGGLVAQAEVGDAHAGRAGVAELGQRVDGPALVAEGGQADLDLRGDVAERGAVEGAERVLVVEEEGALGAARDVDLGLEREAG